MWWKKPDYNRAFYSINQACKPYTMTSVDGMLSLHNAVNYVISNSIAGDFVECGVWRGGSSLRHSSPAYHLIQNMSMPTKEDKDRQGVSAEELMFEKNL